jgi:membrane-associated phospholipid phosphatase
MRNRAPRQARHESASKPAHQASENSRNGGQQTQSRPANDAPEPARSLRGLTYEPIVCRQSINPQFNRRPSLLSKSKSPFQQRLNKDLTGLQSSAAGNLLAATAVATGDESRAIKLRAAIIVTIAVYALAVTGSAFLGVNAPILEGVPLWAGAALLLGFYTRLAFPRTVRLQCFIESVFVSVVLGVSLACLSYVGAAADLPLRDGDMIWIDRHLGFDWLAVMSVLDHSPRLLDVLNGAYATFTAQLVGAAAVLVAAGRMRDLDRFFIIFVCASISAEALSVLVPTLGPIGALADHARFTNLPTLGRTTAEIVLALRDKTLGTIDFEAVNGIISFPSMHAAVAIIVPYTLRWNRWLFAPIAALNAVMLLSAVPSGNHYVADVIAGVAVAVLAIGCGRAIQASFDRLFSSRRDFSYVRQGAYDPWRIGRQPSARVQGEND